MIVHGPKRYENRRWQTSYRGPLLVHAGKSRHWIKDSALERWRAQGLAIPATAELRFGAIVGLCRLADCLPIGRVDDEWASGPWCWRLENVRAFEQPIPCRGGLRLFDVPDELLSNAQMA